MEEPFTVATHLARLSSVIVPEIAFIEDSDAPFFVGDERVGGNGAEDECVSADGAAGSDYRTPAENSGVRVDGDVIFDVRMALDSFDNVTFFIFFETAGPEGHAMVELDAITDDARLADHHTGAVVDKEMFADGGTGVDVDSGLAVSPFGHDPWDQGQVGSVEEVGGTENGYRFNGRVAENNFLVTASRRVTLIGGAHVGGENASNFRELTEKGATEVRDVLA